jgi:ATP-dependent DNA helicase RecQ
MNTDERGFFDSLTERVLGSVSLRSPTPSMRGRALAWLREAVGRSDAEFREGQWEAVESLVERRARLLVVQRTGWGKSLVYFLATKLLRDRGAGCTLLISPLLSLMRNQIEAAERIGIRAETINSTNQSDWPQSEWRIQKGEVDLLLISPERLADDEFVDRCLLPIARRIGLFVVDEAHCISDWGHDFRPDYRRIARILQALPQNIPVLATTATANDRVIRDIVDQLGSKLKVRRGSLMRASLRLQNIHLPSQAQRMAWLAEHLPQLPGSGIVYTLTVHDAERVARWLRSQQMDAEAYHAKIEPEDREILEQRLLQNDLKVLVATVALGMGFDKPDLGFVVHFQRPASVVHYYQQVGRAGRAIEEAYGILLSGEEDDEIADHFFRTAFPKEDDIAQVLDILESAEAPLAFPELQQRLNLSCSVVDRVLNFLSLESPSPVQKTQQGYLSSPAKWAMPFDRIAAITKRRFEERARMRDYMSARDCLMRFLAAELDDPQPAPCGMCINCTGHLLSETYPEELVPAALELLERSENRIRPITAWPSGIDRDCLQGSIHYQAREGRALCRWGDPGWGRLVQTGKQQYGRFDDRLVKAAVQLIRGRWQPYPAPTWVTFVPSAKRPALVAGFARRLALALSLPCVDSIRKVRANAPQKTRANDIQRVKNVIGAFDVDAAKIYTGPVLLVDDVVDSGWTFSVLAMLLRESGCDAVYPFALADASSDDGDQVMRWKRRLPPKREVSCSSADLWDDGMDGLKAG